MPNYSGKWNLQGQLAGIKAGTWTGITIGELYYLGGYVWGNGDDTTSSTGGVRSSPTQIDSSSYTWTHLARNNAIRSDGTLWGWGLYSGDDTVGRSSAVQIGTDTNWSKVENYGPRIAVKSDGTLWTWGGNTYGGLGDNTIITRSSPVQVGALTNWAEIDVGEGHCLAVKTDGTLWGWGRNDNNGQVGDGTKINRSSPVQIGADTDWASVGCVRYGSKAIKTTGAIYTWGSNSSGELGLSSGGGLPGGGPRSTPIQMGALTNWEEVNGGNSSFYARKTDGTLWSWGANTNGRLGINSTNNTSSPVQIGALTDWADFAASFRAGIATKTDGTLWAWGDNGSGELGQNNLIDYSSPVQIGTETNWEKVAASGNAAYHHMSASSRTGMS